MQVTPFTIEDVKNSLFGNVYKHGVMILSCIYTKASHAS